MTVLGALTGVMFAVWWIGVLEFKRAYIRRYDDNYWEACLRVDLSEGKESWFWK